MLSKLFGDPVNKFWKWFAAHESELADSVHKDPVACLMSIKRKFDGYFRGPVVEVQPSRDGGQHILIISADGIRDRIEIVRRLARESPGLTWWRVVAFRQRADLNGGLRMPSGERIDFESLRALAKRAGEFIDVTVYVPDHCLNTPQAGAFLTFIGLDHAIGELDVMTVAGKIDTAPLSKAPPQAVRLPEFAAVFDELAEPLRPPHQ
jgi:hypothetical protein